MVQKNSRICDTNATKKAHKICGLFTVQCTVNEKILLAAEAQRTQRKIFEAFLCALCASAAKGFSSTVYAAIKINDQVLCSGGINLLLITHC